MSRDERVKFLSLKASFESVIDLLEALRNAIQAGAWETAQCALVGVYQLTEYMTQGHFNQYTQVFGEIGQALEARDANEATAIVVALLAHFRAGHVDVAKRAGYSAPKIYGSNDPARAKSPQPLVFVEYPNSGCLVFASLEIATAIDRLHRVCEAKTWEEVRRLLSTEEFDGFFAECDFADTGDFDVAEAIPTFCDGDFPPHLAAKQHQFIPMSILTKYGKLSHTQFNGSNWRIAVQDREALLGELTAAGISAEERADLTFY